MQTLDRLFSRSPFSSIQIHMSKVATCVEEIVPLMEALQKKDYPLIEQFSEKISKLEHEADITKNDIRNHLPTGLFTHIARETILEILKLQDHIADYAENIAVLLTLRPLEIEPIFAQEFHAFTSKNLEAFRTVRNIVQEFGELMESSFGGREAEKVVKMVQLVALQEHEADVLQKKLLKKLFRECDHMPYQSFYLWVRVIKELSSISNESERLANRIRMILEVQ